MKFIVPIRNTIPHIAGLSVKQFALLLYLGLRRTDGGSGWVMLQEIVERVPFWKGKQEDVAGREIGHFYTQYPWFVRSVDHDFKTKGPYRLIPEAEFEPHRDDANEFISSTIMRKHSPPKYKKVSV